mgnify:CR=1 FL=1
MDCTVVVCGCLVVCSRADGYEVVGCFFVLFVVVASGAASGDVSGVGYQIVFE